MRLAIISRSENVSGKEIMTLELGEGLREEGHEVRYVTSHWNDGSYAARLEALGFPLERLDLGSISATLRWDCLSMTLRQLVQLPGLWADYRRFVQRERPEWIIHTSWHHLLLLWPLLKPGRDWFWVHEVLPDKPQYRLFFSQLARRLRGFVPVSEAVARSLRQLGVAAEKIHVIHNGLRDLAESFQLPARTDDHVRLGIVGQVEPWKGHHHLLEAFATIAARHPQAEVHVFGTGTPAYQRQLRQQAEDLGIAARLRWHGYVADRAQIFGTIDVCVIPSALDESFGLGVVEAAFFGLPVVAFRRGGLAEIVKHAETGFLVEVGNLGQLAARLSELLSQRELRESMGAAARQRAKQLFTRKRFVADFIRLLETGAVKAASIHHDQQDQPIQSA